MSPDINDIFPLFWIACHIAAYLRCPNTSLLLSPQLREHQLNMNTGFLNPKLEENTCTFSAVGKGTIERFKAALTQGLLLISKCSLKNQGLLWEG